MPPNAADDAARAALRARQGAGARYDADAAPAGDLLLARRGAAFFARKLNELRDIDFTGPSRRVGWTRARLVADTSFRAREAAIALKSLRENLTAEEATWTPDLDLAETLPVRALRGLFQHSDIHLNVEFRDLSSDDWDREIRIGGRTVQVRTLPLLRAHDLWHGAIDLANGAREADMPDRIRTGDASAPTRK
ncbi:maleylpyruvate isomerase N-terminal domain-containing protein [Cribrihabitans sp. XS_ASV171]